MVESSHESADPIERCRQLAKSWRKRSKDIEARLNETRGELQLARARKDERVTRALVTLVEQYQILAQVLDRASQAAEAVS